MLENAIRQMKLTVRSTSIPREALFIVPQHLLQHRSHATWIIVARPKAALPTGSGDPPPQTIVPQIEFHLIDHLIIRAEELSFLAFVEEREVLVRTLSQHERFTSWNFYASRSLAVAVDLAQETQIDIEAANSSC